MKSNLTNEQLIDKVKAWVKKLCETGGSAWTLKVPVDLDNDPDVLIIELCNRFASQPPAQGGYSLREAEDKAIDDIPMYPIQKIPDNWAGHIHALRKVYASGLVASRNLPPSGNLWEQVDVTELPDDWENKVFLYRFDKTPVDTSLFEHRDNGLVKIGGTGRLEYSEIVWLRPVTGQRYSEEGIKSIEIIEELCENLSLQLNMRGCCGEGDGKDRKADADDYGGVGLLHRTKQFIQSLNKK